jgi:NitT/TauT family transport system substrate-binding protein
MALRDRAGRREATYRLLSAFLIAPVLLVSQAKAEELKVWRHGIVEPNSDAGFVFMASKGGFAEKQGLNIEIVQFKGDPLALRALLAGDLDSYEGSPGAPILAGSRGADIKIAGCYWPVMTYEIYSKQSLNSVADLKGKTLAISSPGSQPDVMVRAVLDKYNIPASQVSFSVLGSDSDRFKALAAGIVDAAADPLDYMPLAKANGIKRLLDAGEELPNYIKRCITVSGKTLKDRGEDLPRFLAAEMNALRFALDHRDQEVSLANEVTRRKPDDERAAFLFDEAKRVSAVDPAMPIPTEKLAWMRDLLLKAGNLKSSVDIKTLVDDGPREVALKLVRQ